MLPVHAPVKAHATLYILSILTAHSKMLLRIDACSGLASVDDSALWRISLQHIISVTSSKQLHGWLGTLFSEAFAAQSAA